MCRLEDNTLQAMYVQCKAKARSGSHCCYGRAIIITCYECVYILSLVVHHANHIFSASVAICDLSGSTIFFTHCLVMVGFSEKIEHKICILILSQSLSATFPILSRIQRHIINILKCSPKVTIFLIRFQSILNFLDTFSKNPQIS